MADTRPVRLFFQLWKIDAQIGWTKKVYKRYLIGYYMRKS